MRLFMNSLGSNTSSKVIPYDVKRFKYGKDFVISSNTDTYGANAEQIEFYSWKYGVRSTVFETNNNTPTVRPPYTQNALESGIYFYTEKTKENGVIFQIPDYYDSTYTAAGESFYVGVTAGDSKPLRYPNNGTQMMYMTNGRLGVKLNQPYSDWDKGVGNIGVNNPPFDPVDTNSLVVESVGINGDGFTDLFNDYKNTSSQGWNSFSFRNGQQGTWQGKTAAIAGRNSESGGNVSGDYFDEWDITSRANLTYPSSTRITDSFFTGDNDTRVSWIKDKIDTVTSVNGGWFRNFTHWHTASMTLMKAFYAMLGTYDDAWFASMSEATEYRWSIDMVDYMRVAESGSTVVVQPFIDNKYNLDLSLFQSFISVEVDLSNTVLGGKNIATNSGKVISLGDNKWIVNVDIQGVTVISEGIVNSFDLIKPSVLSSVLVGSDLTITTDQETRVTLFSDDIGTVIERKYTGDTTHTFTGIVSGTYYLGVMNNTNLSIVEEINI